MGSGMMNEVDNSSMRHILDQHQIGLRQVEGGGQ